jgi:hypothetical protein
MQRTPQAANCCSHPPLTRRPQTSVVWHQSHSYPQGAQVSMLWSTLTVTSSHASRIGSNTCAGGSGLMILLVNAVAASPTGNRQPAHLIRLDVNERGNSWLVNAEWGCWHSCATARMRVASCRHAFDKLCAVGAAVSAACGLLHWACCVRNDSGTSSASITMLHKAIDSLFLETRERGDGYRVTALSPDHALHAAPAPPTMPSISAGGSSCIIGVAGGNCRRVCWRGPVRA